MTLRGLISAAAFAAATLTAAQAGATAIAVTNPSFEQDTTYQNSIGTADLWTSGSISGWSVTGDTGYWHPSTYEYPGGGDTNTPATNVPDGVNVAYSNGGTIAQTLATTLADSTTYTLGVWIGHRADGYWNDYTIELLAGGTVIASAFDPIDPGPGQFGHTTLTYSAGASDPHAGQALGIEFVTNGAQVNYDAVTLNASAVPEPKGLALVAAGLIGLGLMRRRATA